MTVTGTDPAFVARYNQDIEGRSTVSGFTYRYRLGQRDPTTMTFTSPTVTLAGGDFVGFRDGAVHLGGAGDRGLVGVVSELVEKSGARPSIRVVIDSDAVYAIQDPHARVEGVTLQLGGASGEQSVTEHAGGNLTVVVDSGADQETLVRISIGSHQTVSDEEDAGPAGGELNAAIARAVVHHLRERVGRGPTRAQAFYRNEVIVVILQETMTTAERSLMAAGRAEVVKRGRQTFQETMRGELVETIERLTQCKVLSFMSANDVDADMASEVFVLDRPVPRDRL